MKNSLPAGNETETTATTPLGWTLHSLAVAIAAVDTVVAQRLGLSSTEYSAMKHLLSSVQPLGPADLARLLGMSTGSATALIDRLECAGHVERRPHPDDRRRLILDATASTTRAIVTAVQPLGDELTQLGERFTHAEQVTIRRFLIGAIQLHSDFSGS